MPVCTKCPKGGTPIRRIDKLHKSSKKTIDITQKVYYNYSIGVMG